MRQVVGGVGALLVQAVTTAVDLGALTLEAQALGRVGAPVAAAQRDLHLDQVHALRSLLQGMQRVNADVRRVADAYDEADAEIARAFGGVASGGVASAAVGSGDPAAVAPAGLLAGLWSSGVGAAVADHATGDAGAGEPGSVGNVVGYLRDAGVGRVGAEPLPSGRFDGPSSFGDWLDADPAHQTHVGVIHVYRGDVRDLADIPGGVRRGDVVVIDPDTAIAVATADTRTGAGPALVNHGLVDAALGHRTSVRVYRPL